MLAGIREREDTPRVADLRRRVREAMEVPPVAWECPARIDDACMGEPLPVRKARAIALKLSRMPADLWDGQPLAGSMTLEAPRVHAEWGFPDYVTDEERAAAAARGLSIYSVFGHIVPDYPTLLAKGLRGIRADAEAQRPHAQSAAEHAFLDSVVVAVDGAMAFAARLSEQCESEAAHCPDAGRASELRVMAGNLRRVPAGPAQTFWQALQSVWLLHMAFHSTLDGNALGRLDQYAWPYLQADLEAGRLDLERAAELVDCFCLKFNERAKTTDEQRPEARAPEAPDPARRTRHSTSSQIGTRRDGLDATNHWLQNIVVGGLTPEGRDGTNPLTFFLLESYRRNQMTNPLLTVRLHRESPEELVRFTCEVLRDGGGMPALFNDEALIPALERIGIPTPDARDYTNDGCWEIILPGRTDFGFQRLSLMLCLEWALNRGRSRLDGAQKGIDTGDPRRFAGFEDVWQAFQAQLEAMVERAVQHVVETIDDRSTIAPVPLLSALIDGAITSRRDLTAGGAKYRTFALLAEGAAHAIDSLAGMQHVLGASGGAPHPPTPSPARGEGEPSSPQRAFVTGADWCAARATPLSPRGRGAGGEGAPPATQPPNHPTTQPPLPLAALCDALDADFEGCAELRNRLLAGPKYGNDDPEADAMGRRVIDAFVGTVARHAEAYRSRMRFPCGVGTFSWYIGIGEGLGASPDGRLAGEPVSSNFSPALGRDREGIPGAILSYARMHDGNLPAGGPLDLRLARKLVEGPEGTGRMAALVRSFVETGGNMLTLTVVDAEELRAAQREPERYRSLRVRMGGWCAYFTMLSREQQEHHIRRQASGDR